MPDAAHQSANDGTCDSLWEDTAGKMCIHGAHVDEDTLDGPLSGIHSNGPGLDKEVGSLHIRPMQCEHLLSRHELPSAQVLSRLAQVAGLKRLWAATQVVREKHPKAPWADLTRMLQSEAREDLGS